MDRNAGDPRTAEDRLTVLEQIGAITALKYRYWRACDAKDPAGMRECFVSGRARIDYGPLGSFDNAADLVQVYASIALRTLDDGSYAVLDMHHGLHPVIDVTDAGHARGRWTLQFRQIDRATGTERVSAGEYEDEYTIENGSWRIAATTYTPKWMLSRPLGEAVVNA